MNDWDARIKNFGTRLRRKGHSEASLARLGQEVRRAQRDLDAQIDTLQHEFYARLRGEGGPCFYQEQQSYRLRLQGLGSLQRTLDGLADKVRKRKPEQEDLAGSFHLTD